MGLLSDNLLTLVIWIPVLGGILVLATGDDRRADRARQLALVFSVVTFVLSLPLWGQFQLGSAEMQFVERAPWIDRFNIEYYLGIDGISMPLVLLTTFLTIIVVIAGWRVIQTRVAQYFAAFQIGRAHV